MVNFSLPGVSYANRFFKDKSYYRCIMLGQGNTGKTTLLYRLKLKEQIATIPTMRQSSNVETVHVLSEDIDITFWDKGGGCDRTPQWLFQQYQGPDVLFLFAMDPTEIFDQHGTHIAQYAIEDLKHILERITEAKYLAVIFNKRNQMLRGDPRVERQISSVKEVLDEYRPKLSYPCELYDDLDQLSGATDAQTDLLVKRLTLAAQMEKNYVRGVSMKAMVSPHHSSLRVPKPLTDDFLGRKETGSNEANDQLDSDEFMRRMVSGELEKWDHQYHLRAGFLTLKKCLLKESVIFDAADMFLERLDMMLKAAPHKFRDTSPHRTGLFPDRKGFNDVILENPDLTDSSSWDPYSETQAFFWIQMLHAALETIPINSGLDITNLRFKSISILLPSLFETDDIWRRYYTETLWTSLKARARTTLPDLKSLRTALQTPEQWLIQRAVASVLYEKYPCAASDASLSYCSSDPSAEELLLEVRWAVKEARNSSFNNSMIPATHAMLVYRIFNYLLDAEILPEGDRSDSRRTASLSTASWDATSFLHQQGRPHETKQRYTAAVFWSRMVLHAFIETDKVSSFHAKFASWRLSSPSHQVRRQPEPTMRVRFFEQFLLENPELCWEGLWIVYYSDELWRSEDARIMYVIPD
ncbi:hypothetical protein ACO22_04213 [Paracoccidioides brasiliensis]|uniref:Uncharacterized protein n=1 Tax=Paracoccidioides brasiliensis TaxID=121759 RepID=A0A1D2JDQ0_PARBR|nr:hypothetical protein ACO22_04213 [Paracoccidioides brasiliensis]